MPPLRLLITAPPGTGKTTLCERVRQQMAELAAAPSACFQLEGFLCHERRESGRRVGFDLVSLEGERAPLASMNGPETGHMVGRYHVQVKQFEDLALPILERVAKGTGRRLLIFDEIGKMELFSSRFQTLMRQLLPSRDGDLHILGTVALNGGGLIKQSKEFPGVEVLEIDAGTRDAMREDVARRCAEAVQAPGGLAPPSQQAADAPAAAPAEASAPLARLPSAEEFTFAEAPAPGSFTPVYPEDPPANFASLNAGDYLLYVGGNAINRAFAEALQRAGHDCKGRFELLHEALLEAASKAPGKLCWLRSAALFPKSASGSRTATCSYCKERADCWETSRAGWSGQPHCKACWDYYVDWALGGMSAVCGLVPASGDGSGASEELLAALRPVGLVALSIFRSRKRPRGSERNVAMVYTVGPNCGGVRKKGRREVDKLSPAAFLQVLEALGHAVARAVAGYNAERTGMEDSCGPLPRIDELRVCLVSGGVYRHPDASKEDVARALLTGAARGHAAGGAHSPHFDFAWDDDVFRIAWTKITAEKGKGSP